MELTVRDWMVIIGAGLILAVLIDAARRVYKERRSEIRLNTKLGYLGSQEGADDNFDLLSELPNGGARIVGPEDLAANPESSETLTPDQPTAASEAVAVKKDAPPEPESAEQRDHTRPPIAAGDENDGLMVGMSSRDETPENLDWLDQLDNDESEEDLEAGKLPRSMDPHVFVLNVVARSDGGFSGRAILQILLACDLRFGDMDFFHRHEQAAGKGPIQFSVANMINPGVFDIDNMEVINTRGLMFFVTLPGPEDMLKAFDYMYETAKTVAKNLDGDVLDETHSVVTQQSLEHMRQQIRELERRILVESER